MQNDDGGSFIKPSSTAKPIKREKSVKEDSSQSKATPTTHQPTLSREGSKLAKNSTADPLMEFDLKLPNKLGRLSANISSVTEKTRSAKDELQRMFEITKELRNQCNLQEMECKTLESDQQKIKQEVESVNKRLESLLEEKQRVEQKLEQLRMENAQLEEFLDVSSLYFTL